MDNIKDKIRRICTYHGDEGTSGYELTEEQFQRIFALFDQQKQELLAALTIEKKDLDVYAQHEYELAKNMRIEGWNACADELSRMKKEI